MTNYSSLDVGATVEVTVPASSANLGPGYDTLGLAVSLYDTVTVEVVSEGIEVAVTGEGAGELPSDGTHLVVQAIQLGLRTAGFQAPGLKVTCVNSIPQSRGLGSSAAAAVAGVVAANGLVGFALSNEELVQLASTFEGHPDNAAASVLGAAIVSWTVPNSQGQPKFHARSFPVHPDIKATAFVFDTRVSTQSVRKVLPAIISHADASFNAGRAALNLYALQHEPGLLMEATEDKLHQPYRKQVLVDSFAWVETLRDKGFAAYLSGAGPTVMALHTDPLPQELIAQAQQEGIAVLELEPAGPVDVDVLA